MARFGGEGTTARRDLAGKRRRDVGKLRAQGGSAATCTGGWREQRIHKMLPRSSNGVYMRSSRLEPGEDIESGGGNDFLTFTFSLQ
jgi:hypothetical protein